MGRQKLSEEERLKRRRERDKLRKRRQREARKRQEEIVTDFLSEIAGVKPTLPNGDQTEKNGHKNPDKVKRCSQCGHLLPFCSCARDQNGRLKQEGDWLTGPII